MTRPKMEIVASVLGTSDPLALAQFYERLLGWTLVDVDPTWVKLRPPTGETGLSFQLEDDYVPPVWPATPGQQQMTAHLDVAVDDLDAAVAWAVEAGASLADFQPREKVRVMLDPAGHPFCLFPASD
jgi:catechol 2,3-dioxygenase-like lactoylglutathione lyase family enzyme